MSSSTKWERPLGSDTTFKFGHYISRGFDLAGKNLGLHILFLLCLFGIFFACALIPFIGVIALWVITPCLILGPAIVSYYTDKGHSVDINNFFDGFRQFGNVVSAYLFTVLATSVATAPGLLYLFTQMRSFTSNQLVEENLSESNPDAMRMFMDFLSNGFLWKSMLLIGLPVMIVAALLGWSMHFAWFYNMSGMEAVRASAKVTSKYLWQIVLFSIVVGLLGSLGIFLFIIGILFTYPASLCMQYAAFADVTGLLEEEESPEVNVIDHFGPIA